MHEVVEELADGFGYSISLDRAQLQPANNSDQGCSELATLHVSFGGSHVEGHAYLLPGHLEHLKAIEAKQKGLEEGAPLASAPVPAPELEPTGLWAVTTKNQLREEKLNILDFPPRLELFKKLVPAHCLGSIWSQRDRRDHKYLAPTICDTVAHTNTLANSVIATCLGALGMTAQDRARMVELWIHVAEEATSVLATAQRGCHGAWERRRQQGVIPSLEMIFSYLELLHDEMDYYVEGNVLSCRNEEFKFIKDIEMVQKAANLYTVHPDEHFGAWFQAVERLSEEVRESSSVEVDTHSENATSSESTGRTLLIHGPVELKRGWRRQKRHLFLLSDLLLITNTNYKKNFKIKNKVPLNTIWIANCLDKFGEADTSAKRSFVLGWPTVNFVATFSSSELKEKWHSSLQRCINLAKEKDQPESIPLKIITEDIKNCVCSVTVTVTNSDTVNNVINMSLPMLGITGSEKDYQLWVSSGKKEAPCPLTGHEHPYIIKMSHRPATGLLPQGPEGSTFQESPDMQGQFILKPRHPARNQQRTGQKSVRINFMGNWALRRGSSACQDLPYVTPPSAKPGQLFGVSLGDVCERDSLPPSLLDMLCFLKQKGPLTEGIFRKSANMKSCRALKETLNAGDKVNLDCESVLVVACVLKDFLRNIPGSVFTSDLYAKWVSITDGENEEEKIAATQRLLDELPRANAALLRYLFGVLHNIQQHSSVNQMTAYNLATCIAPSILCLPNACSAELESDITRKISLVQFLIENSLQIFGEDIASLLGESSMHCDGSEKAIVHYRWLEMLMFYPRTNKQKQKKKQKVEPPTPQEASSQGAGAEKQ
ncbi:rho GTPase-activating protein 20-like [Equus asinus]|uniref:rho GTPase-activating protein 20-like n=1 Tax=Equus asinus TaxID=9793 RepID=UPI0038F7A41A